MQEGPFNDPEARYCGICVIHMVQDKAARVKEPVLGFLVLDDGTSYKLDCDHVLGSDPHTHDAVTSGRARPRKLVGAGLGARSQGLAVRESSRWPSAC